MFSKLDTKGCISVLLLNEQVAAFPLTHAAPSYLNYDFRQNLLATPLIMFLFQFCGFLNPNPYSSFFILHSRLLSRPGFQNLQSHHCEDTTDYSAKQCTEEVNFSKNHLCYFLYTALHSPILIYLITCKK